MGRNMLSLLILCSILTQGIGTLSNAKIEKSLDLHIRRKRIIDTTPHGNNPVEIELVRYIVSLHKNGAHTCGASILSHNVIITASHCVATPGVYSIVSGSAIRNRGTRHNVTRTIKHPHANFDRFMHDIALLVISPPIDLLHSPNRKIELYNEYPRPNTPAIFSGWGCIIEREGHTLKYPNELRSTTVTIMGLRECQNSYKNLRQTLHNHIVINEKDICTGELNGKKGSCNGDSGGPLVINDKLAGVMSFKSTKAILTTRQNPDIFVNLAHPLHKFWIIQKTQEFSTLIHVHG